MSDAFSSQNATLDDDLPQTINRDVIRKIMALTAEPEVQDVINTARKMQKRSRQIWNPHGDEVMLVNYTGLVSMDKDTTQQNGALGLDLQAKCGMIAKDASGRHVSGTWQDMRRIYMVRDAKTTDLLEKCLHNLTHNPVVSVDKKELEELDTFFVNALKRLHVKQGDWHAGLTVLQAIMNTFWDVFIQALVNKLRWNRIHQDCRDCYFQTSCLIRYVYHRLLKILMEIHASTHHDKLQADFELTSTDLSDANLYCFIAKRFGQWLRKLNDSTYAWL